MVWIIYASQDFVCFLLILQAKIPSVFFLKIKYGLGKNKAGTRLFYIETINP